MAFRGLLGMLIVSQLLVMNYATSASAAPQLLQGAYSYVNCKTNFTASVVDQFIVLFPNHSGLVQNVSILQQETGQLQDFANQNNYTEFRNFYISVYMPELNLIVNSLVTQRKSANLSSSNITALRNDYNYSKQQYDSCSFGALKTYAQGEIATYQGQVASYQSIDSNLGQRLGIDTGSLNQTLSGAQAQVIAPLQSALNSATNTSQILKSFSSYCLFDGCQNGLNYHLDAKYYTQALGLGLGRLKQVPGLVNSSVVSTMQGDISTASSALNATGPSVYTTNESTEIYTSLDGAVLALKNAILNYVHMKRSKGNTT